jgi:hypothetical protein
MNGLEAIFGTPQKVEFNQELYEKNTSENDYSEKANDMRSNEDKEVE